MAHGTLGTAVIARTLVLLANVALVSADDVPPTGQTIVFLSRPEGRIVDEALLLDAVAIYTRDLGLKILRSSERRPAVASATVIDDVAALLRSRGARLAFWCQRAADGRSIELVMVDARRSVTRHVFSRDATPASELHRAIALEVRVSLVGMDAAAAAASAGGLRPQSDALPPAPPGAAPNATAAAAPVATPAPRERPGRAAVAARPTVPLSSPAPASTAAPPAPSVVPTATDRSAVGNRPASEPLVAPPVRPITATTAITARQAEANERPSRGPVVVAEAKPTPVGAPASPYPVFVAAGYALSLPTGSAPWRHAAALHGVATLGVSKEIDLGAELASAEGHTTGAGSVSVTDLPIRLGVRLVRRTSSYLVAIGLLGGAHLLFVRATDAAPGTGTDETRAVAASGGLEVLARGPSVLGFAPEFRGWVEANLPRTRFLLHGAPGFETGALTAGFGLGVALPAR